MTIRQTASLGVSLLFLLGVAFAALSNQTQTAEKVAFAAPAADFIVVGVPSDRTPEEYQGSFLYRSSSEMLAALQVTVYPEDKVYAFPDPSFGLGSRIWVYRAQPVVVKDGKEERLIRTWAKTVEEVLTEQKIELADKDIVQPSKHDAITLDGRAQTITITRVAEAEVSTKQDIAFTTTYKDDATLEKGQEKVEQAGKVGSLQKTFKVRRENGKEVSRVLMNTKTLQEPVQKVVVRGTKVVSYGSGRASWYKTASMTAAHRTLPFGTKVLVKSSTGKSVIVTIADRGPFIDGRIIDLSSDAFAQLAPLGAGTISVTLEKTY